MKLKSRRKVLSLLLTVAMLVTLLVPMVGPAAAASTYTVSNVQTVSASTYNAGNFNRIIVEVPANQVAGTYNLRMRLPSDFYTDVAVNFTNITGADPNQVTNVVPTAVGTANPVAANGGNNEWNFAVTLGGAGTSFLGRFYIDLNGFTVASGANGDVNATFDAAGNTPFSTGPVKIASVGTGIVTLSIDEVNSITSSGTNTIGQIRFKEDRPGALKSDTQTLKIKLPNGFTWNNPGVIANVWGTAVNFYNNGVLSNIPATTDSGRTLVINTGGAAGNVTATAGYWSLTGATVSVDESIAKIGDIEATVDGNSSYTPSTLVVGTYGDYGVTVSSSDATTVLAGRMGNGNNTKDTEIGKIVIQESAAGSLRAGRSITLTLTGGAKWNVGNRNADGSIPAGGATVGRGPSVDETNSDRQGLQLGGWTFVGTEYDTIKANITTESTGSKKGGKLVLEKGQIDLAADAKGDIKVTVGGTAGASGDAGVVATASPPASISIDGTAPDAIIGLQGQKVADIIVTENVKEGIQATGANNAIYLEFFQNVVPSLPTKVEVIDGDITIDDSSMRKDVTGDGRWQIQLKIKSTSSKPSKIKFSGITITTDRTTPEGPTKVALKGPALLQTSTNINYPFPGVTSMGSVAVANIVTPTETSTKIKAVFKIGEAKFTANGVEKTMDVESYIENGRTYIPMRFAANALGVNDSNIIWNPDTSTATFIKGDKVVQVKDGSNELVVNGVTITMDVAATIKDGRFMVPFRFVAQAFGAAVEWDDATQTVTMDL